MSPTASASFARVCRRLSLAATLGLLATACGPHEYSLDDDGTGARAAARTAGSTGSSSSWREAVGELILPLIEKHDTEYAPGYREEVFRALKPGMTQKRVAQLLGQPLLTKRFPDGITCWYYTRHGKRSENYFVRVLEFDGQGILLARRKHFYVD